MTLAYDAWLGQLDPPPPKLAEPRVQTVEPARSVEPNTTPEADLWSARPALQHIRAFAYARLCSPWAVLGVALLRVLHHVPPWVTLPPLIGGRGSLNAFVALVGPPGSGKGAAEAAG